MVGPQHGIIEVDASQDVAHKSRTGSGICRREERPGALAMTFDEATFDEKLQMTRNPRLRLPEDRDEFAHGQFGLRQKDEQPKACPFARSLERRQGGRERKQSHRHDQYA